MRNISKAKLSSLIALAISLSIMWPASSYADWHDHDGDHDRDDWHSHDRDRDHHHFHSFVGFNFSVWPNNYYYGAPYYPPMDAAFFSPPIYQPVVINGATYYLNNGTYYIYNSFGYQVVAPPLEVVQQPVTFDQPTVVIDSQLLGADSFTINIPNDKGGYTAVTLKKSGNGFIGPQGEFYPQFPGVAQLKVIYGK